MARDYSSRRNNPPDKNGKRKRGKRPPPAARPVGTKKKSAPKKKSGGGNSGRAAPGIRAGAPGCIWLLCGLFLGVAGFSAYYIMSRPAGHGPDSVSVPLPSDESADSGRAQDAEADNAAPTADTSAARGNATDKKPRFTFYQMLPDYEVEIPDDDRAGQPATDEHAPHEAEPDAKTPAPKAPVAGVEDRADKPRQPAAQDQRSGAGYLIQAGAFSTERDADRRKARLALLGVAANIVDIRSASGKTVYRVQSNTLKSRGKARSLAQRLQSHDIETIVRQAD